MVVIKKDTIEQCYRYLALLNVVNEYIPKDKIDSLLDELETYLEIEKAP